MLCRPSHSKCKDARAKQIYLKAKAETTLSGQGQSPSREQFAAAMALPAEGVASMVSWGGSAQTVQSGKSFSMAALGAPLAFAATSRCPPLHPQDVVVCVDQGPSSSVECFCNVHSSCVFQSLVENRVNLSTPPDSKTPCRRTNEWMGGSSLLRWNYRICSVSGELTSPMFFSNNHVFI